MARISLYTTNGLKQTQTAVTNDVYLGSNFSGLVLSEAI
jgi:hypothetical protein